LGTNAINSSPTTQLQMGLIALSNEVAKNSGVNDLLTNCLEQWFGKWKGAMTSILTSLLVFGAIWVLHYTLYMGTNFKLIETALTKQFPYHTNYCCIQLKQRVR
jgi:hypothetical protein